MATREWVRFNESSKAKRNREQHVELNGGLFTKGKKGWKWTATPVVERVTAPPIPKTETPKKKKFGLG